MSDFETSLNRFLNCINEAQKVYHKDSPCKYSDNPSDRLTKDEVFYGPIEVQPGRKYLRLVIHSGPSTSVYCFVEKATGNILKAASWKTPAKFSRSSIFKPEDWETISPANLIYGSWLYAR